MKDFSVLKNLPAIILGILLFSALLFIFYYINDLFIQGGTKPIFFFSKEAQMVKQEDKTFPTLTIDRLWTNDNVLPQDAAIKKLTELKSAKEQNTTNTYNIALYQIVAKDYPSATNNINKLLQQDSKNLDYQLAKAYIYFAKSSYKDALYILEETKQPEKKDYRLYLYKGYVLEKLEDKQEAKNNYTEALKISPSNIKAKMALKKLL